MIVQVKRWVVINESVRGLGIVHGIVPENGVPHNVKLGKFWLIVSHGLLLEKQALLNIVAGENQGGNYWLWAMLFCWLSMFPGPLKRSVNSARW